MRYDKVQISVNQQLRQPIYRSDAGYSSAGSNLAVTHRDRRQFPDAGLITSGILITILAAAIQTSSLEVRAGQIIVDNNGLFRLVQLMALPLLVEGVRAGL